MRRIYQIHGEWSNISLIAIKSEFNVADIHTKCLAGKMFKNLRDKVMRGFGGDSKNIHQFMDEYDT